MKKKSIFCSVLTLCMMLLSFSGFAQINTNGGFESWTGTSPDGWLGSKSNIAASNVVKVTTGAHSGNYACQLINTTSSHKRFTTQTIHVDNGTQYEISFWVKGHGDIRVAMYDGRQSGSGYSSYSPYYSINSTTYQQCVDTIEAAVTTDDGEFILSLRNTENDHLIVDDVTITPITPENFVGEPVVTISGTQQSTDTYFGSVIVSLSSITDNASIYYTMDGSEPTSSSTLYSAPFTINSTTTLKAIAILNDNNSTVMTKTITILDFVPIFFENFETNGLDLMTVVNVSGTYSWTTGTNNGNTYAYANAYNQGACESWLITPALVPLNPGGVTMSFESATKYTGPALQVKYSTDYSGSGSPASATWNDITDEFVFSTGNNWVWTNSGDFDVIGSAPVYFAWIYTSEASTAAGWQIDNIMVTSGTAPVLTPSLTINEPLNGAVYSTLDTLHVGIDIQNFTLDTDGYLKIESNFLMNFLGTDVIYMNQMMMDFIPLFPLSPLPVGEFYFTASLVDMDSNALSPAVSVSAAFTVVAPVLDAPVITAAGENAGADNTFYFNSTVTMTADSGASIYYTTNGTTPTDSSMLYTASFQITETTTIKAIAVKEYYQNSDVATLTVTITAPTVETPVFTPGTGTYADSVTFSIACATEGAVIRYTIDGTEPNETSTLYSAPVSLTATTTVKAKAFKTDWFASETATSVYTIVFEPVLTVSTPTLSFTSTQLTQTFTVSGAHLDNPIVLTCSDAHFTLSPTTITNPNSNTVVTVTFDGTEPATGTVSLASGTLSVQVALTATAQLPAPVFVPATDEDTLITVTMTCADPTAEIHYTTDGTTPTAASATYTTPLILSSPGTYTLKALAVKTGWENSDITTGNYTVTVPPAPDTVSVPVITPATNTYYEPQTVTITCTDANAVIRYTIDGTEPTDASTIYTAPFTVTTNSTIVAKAWKSGMIPSATASVSITFPEQVSNIAAFKAAAATGVEKQIMSDVTFVFRSGRYIFVEDNSAALLIYDFNTPVITTQYNEGDVIEGGIFGKYKLYSGMVEMEPTHNANAATGTPVTVMPTTTTITDIKTQYADTYESKFVKLNDVVFIDDTRFVQNGDTMAIFDRFNTITTTISAGDIADVTGFVSYFATNNAYQIFPRDNNDIEIHSAPVLDTVATPEFDFYRSGEFYFMNITCSTDGASLYYTIDNTDPDENSYEYTSDVPFYLNVHYYIKAIAMKEGMVNSAIAMYDYNPSSIITYELRDNLVVYPNPAESNVFINVKEDGLDIEKVELYNLYGQLLKSVEVNSNTAELGIGALATGTYYAKVFTNRGVTSLPIIRK